MNIVTPPTSQAAGARADRAIRLTATLTTAYLALTLWPMAAYWRGTGSAGPLSAHLAALAIAGLALTRGRRTALADWLPLLLGPLLYIELRWLVAGAGRPHADALVMRWEAVLFHSNPSATWAPAHPSLALSELLHASYASYYLLVYLPPALLWVRGRREGFARTMLGLALVYGVCFITYMLFPVDGPRFLVGAAAAPAGPVRSFVLQLLQVGSSRGTAFPSSHIAASVVASLAALGAQRPVGVAVTLLTLGLTLGTVYGGFHYGVDALAGLLTGFAAWGAASWLWHTRLAPGEQSATAAR